MSFSEVKNMIPQHVYHLPIIKAYADKLDLVNTVNKLVPSNMETDIGTVVLGLVIDTLSGRSPLYQLESFFEHTNRELLLGSDIPSSAFNDTNLGRVMKTIYAEGTSKILTGLSLNVYNQFEIDRRHIHFDTTSINTYGDYELAQQDDSVNIVYGYSKDSRPDLKQFIVSMLCAGGNIPLITKIEDGNTADKKANENMLNTISKHMKENKEIFDENFVYIADSALVNENNLSALKNNRFITRLPASYGECKRAIQQAVEDNNWTKIGVLSQEKPTKNRPLAFYKTSEQTVELYGEKYRAVVVHSTANDKRKQKSLTKQLEKSQKKLKTQLKPYLKRSYCCKDDALAEKKEVMAIRTRYHTVKATVAEKVIYKKGRLKKGEKRKVDTIKYYLKVDIEDDTSAAELKEKEYGCFIMLTNIPKPIPNEEAMYDYTAKQILQYYKEQSYMEKNFSFLKDDRIVNGLFLKKPEHIEVIGMILVIALMIWRLIEHEMRKSLKNEAIQVAGWDNKPTHRPTAFMLTVKFKHIIVLQINGETILGQSLNENLIDFLTLLGLDQSIFTAKMQQ